MKIFGKEFITKKELKEKVAQLEAELSVMHLDFPFYLGQVVYDVQLRNEKGRYAKKNASLEHSLVNVVTVDMKNYFNLVERYKKQDVFTNADEAQAFINNVCTHE